MNKTTNTAFAARRQLREALTDAILFRIEQDVREGIPTDFAEDVRKAVVGDILSNSRYVLESLCVEQLQNECSLDRHIDGAVATATYLVHRIQAQRNRG